MLSLDILFPLSNTPAIWKKNMKNGFILAPQKYPSVKCIFPFR